MIKLICDAWKQMINESDGDPIMRLMGGSIVALIIFMILFVGGAVGWGVFSFAVNLAVQGGE